MQGLKRRFSQWFNKKHIRKGTLWESRFKSLLVEDGYAARVISAYIDLNPIRAGMRSRPEDYRWSSYGMAMKPKADAARHLARAGLCRVMQLDRETGGRVPLSESEVLWEGMKEVLEGDTAMKEAGVKNEGGAAVLEEMTGAQWYRTMLYADGEEVFISKPAIGVEKFLVRVGFKREDVEDVLARGGKLSFGEADP